MHWYILEMSVDLGIDYDELYRCAGLINSFCGFDGWRLLDNLRDLARHSKLIGMTPCDFFYHLRRKT